MRLKLLSAFGRRPLDEWLPAAIDAAGFFAFSPERAALHFTAFRLSVMSSFLDAEKGNALVSAWLRYMVSDWSQDTSLWDMGYWAVRAGFQREAGGGNATAARRW